MEIVRRTHPDHLELVFEGRLDGYSAQHLATTVGEVMREGTHSVRLNLAQTSYISSAGIGVLVTLYKQFRAVNGSFALIEPSRQVKQILDLVGLDTVLFAGKADGGQPLPGEKPTGGGKPAMAGSPARQPQIEVREVSGAVFEIHDCAPGPEVIAGSSGLACELIGQPHRLATAGFSADHCHSLTLGEDQLVLGLGAFGDTFDSCQDRFGEFLAVASAAACQPTDGTNFPDYMLSSGAFVPRLSALYGLSCQGHFGKLVRFESASRTARGSASGTHAPGAISQGRPGDPVPLSLIAETCLEIAGADTAGIVIVGESAGLIGAVLTRSPVDGGGARVFAYPEIRHWLSFSPEHCYARALALIAGVASRSAPPDLRSFVRPLTPGSKVSGHFHAAAFGYRPLQKGRVEMRATVRELFEAGGLQGVMHLLADDRAPSGASAGSGESELLRGACWVGPVRNIRNHDAGEDR